MPQLSAMQHSSISAVQHSLYPIDPEIFSNHCSESHLGKINQTNIKHFTQFFKSLSMRSTCNKLKKVTFPEDPEVEKKIHVIPNLTELPTEEKLKMFYSDNELKKVQFDQLAKIFPPKNIKIFLENLFSSNKHVVKDNVDITVNNICDWMEKNQLNHRELFKFLKKNLSNPDSFDQIKDLKISYKNELIRFEKYKTFISQETKDLILNLIDDDGIYIPSTRNPELMKVQDYEHIYNESIIDAFITKSLPKWVDSLTNEALAIL